MLIASIIVAYAIVLLQALGICLLYYRIETLNGRSRQDFSFDIPVGLPAPEFEAVTVSEQEKISSINLTGKKTSIIFVSSNCPYCTQILDQLSSSQSDHKENDIRMFLICTGSDKSCDEIYSELPSFVVGITNPSIDMYSDFRIAGVPAMVELDEEWRISKYTYAEKLQEKLEDRGLSATL